MLASRTGLENNKKTTMLRINSKYNDRNKPINIWNEVEKHTYLGVIIS